MAINSVDGEAVGMATTEQAAPSALAGAEGAVPPAVVCVLNGSPPGRAAAAYAAALSRVLGWRLALVASGLQPLEPAALARAVMNEDGGVVVVPAQSCSSDSEATDLAELAGVPVVVVPAALSSGK
jgi:hypothetical protein